MTGNGDSAPISDEAAVRRLRHVHQLRRILRHRETQMAEQLATRGTIARARVGTALPVHSAIGPASPARRLGASHIPAARRQPDIEGDHGPWEFPSDASRMPARVSVVRTWR